MAELIELVDSGDIDAITKYLNKYPNSINDYCYEHTALYAATRKNDIIVVKLLLDRGAKTNIITDNDNHLCPIICAKEYDILKLLLDKHDCLNDCLIIAAMKAVRLNREKIALLLLSYLKSNDDLLHIYAQTLFFDCTCVTKFIIDNYDVNIRCKNNVTMLIRAVIGFKYDTVKLLIDHGADVYVKPITGMTAIQHTELWTGLEKIGILLKSYAPYVQLRNVTMILRNQPTYHILWITDFLPGIHTLTLKGRIDLIEGVKRSIEKVRKS